MRTRSPSDPTTRTGGLCPLPSHSSSLSEWRCRVLSRKYIYRFQIDIIHKKIQVNIFLILMYEHVYVLFTCTLYNFLKIKTTHEQYDDIMKMYINMKISKLLTSVSLTFVSPITSFTFTCI